MRAFTLLFLFLAVGAGKGDTRPVYKSHFIFPWKGTLPPLVDPEEAPPEIREEVLQGYEIMIETKKNAPGHVGNSLSCHSCHFEGGNTTGGVNGSISLVGVPYIYPRYSARDGRAISLAERINSCFMRSMNGSPLPLDGPQMKALLTYLQWISEPVKGRKEFPWLNFAKLREHARADSKRGAEVYKRCCASCHGNHGEGVELAKEEELLSIPPLLGRSLLQ